MSSTPLPRPLSVHETRVLGVLVEKEKTVPDSYPLSLNAIVLGANQKTSRAPLLELSERDAQEALDALRPLSLVVESSGSRVMRYAHNLPRVLGIPTEAAALVATLMLRGPQTPGELRTNAERLHRFADLSSLEAYLAELRDRPAGALVVELARAPGARETRWMHLLGDPDDNAFVPVSASATAPVSAATVVADDARFAALEARVAALEARLAELGG